MQPWLTYLRSCACTLSVGGGLLSGSEQEITDDYGPLYVQAQAPLQAQAYTPQLRSGRVFSGRRLQLHFTGTASSVWAESSEYFMDYYHNEFNFGATVAIATGWEWEINIQHGYAGNNGLDSITIAFHDLFGIDQNGRDEVPEDQFVITSEEYGVDVTDFKNEIFSNAVANYLGYQIYQDEQHAVSAGYGISYDYVSSGPFKKSRWEHIGQLNYTYSSTPLHTFHATFGLGYSHDNATPGGLPLNDWSAMLGGGYQWRPWQRHALLLEYHLFQGEAANEPNFSEVAHEILLGYRYHFRHAALEFSAIENARNMDNSTDISFSLGYRHRY